MQLVIGAGRTAAIQSRFRSVTTATTPSRRRPWANRARQPVGPGVERPIGQGAVAVHGRDGVRMVPHVLLEQLVDPTVRYRSPRAGEPFERWRSPQTGTSWRPPASTRRCCCGISRTRLGRAGSGTRWPVKPTP